MKLRILLWVIMVFPLLTSYAQQTKVNFTRADSLRGSIGPERAWWDVLRYDITITPDIEKRIIKGTNTITCKAINDEQQGWMQIDLMYPLKIDRVILHNKKLKFFREDNVYHVRVPKQKLNSQYKVRIDFSGNPRIAPRAPWDGGWTFTTDSLGRPWVTVTCQGLGASVWYPNKDHQSDEPDLGASLKITVPDTLVAVSNGKIVSIERNKNHTVTYKWNVVNPINNYNLIPYIGKYVNFSDTYAGERGNLDVDYWVLDYNLEKAKAYLPLEVHNMLKAFEYWFGPYPFYEDGYKIVDVSHTGMEHQSAIAYGNWYKPGYRGRDASGTGWGLKWDFIVVHESGHEWFGNNITSKDLADMWVHEGFTNYSETLFVDFMYGEEAGNEYNYGIRKGIKNDKPIIPPYGVNAQGSGDMYPKGGNLLHTIRHSINDDSLFRRILRGLNHEFYHQTVTTKEIENYISQKAGFDYSRVFDQYLRSTGIPKFEYFFENNTLNYRWADCVSGFNLPVVIKDKNLITRLYPSTEWKQMYMTKELLSQMEQQIPKQYYVNTGISIRNQ